MAKPDWGTKRTCPGCGARFYDLNKQTPTCPTCDTTIETQTAKPRKPVVVAKEPVKPVKEEVNSTDDNGADAMVEKVVIEVDDENDDDDSLIEDTSDLEEDDGMDEVKDHMESEISDDS